VLFAMMLFDEYQNSMPQPLFDITFDSILQFSLSQSSIPISVFDRFRFFTSISLQLTSITCPASSILTPVSPSR